MERLEPSGLRIPLPDHFPSDHSVSDEEDTRRKDEEAEVRGEQEINQETHNDESETSFTMTTTEKQGKSVYKHVKCGKKEGQLILSSQGVTFRDGPANPPFRWKWRTVADHQTRVLNKNSYELILQITEEEEAIDVQFFLPNEESLNTIWVDITIRLRIWRHAHHNHENGISRASLSSNQESVWEDSMAFSVEDQMQGTDADPFRAVSASTAASTRRGASKEQKRSQHRQYRDPLVASEESTPSLTRGATKEKKRSSASKRASPRHTLPRGAAKEEKRSGVSQFRRVAGAQHAVETAPRGATKEGKRSRASERARAAQDPNHLAPSMVQVPGRFAAKEEKRNHASEARRSQNASRSTRFAAKEAKRSLASQDRRSRTASRSTQSPGVLATQTPSGGDPSALYYGSDRQEGDAGSDDATPFVRGNEEDLEVQTASSALDPRRDNDMGPGTTPLIWEPTPADEAGVSETDDQDEDQEDPSPPRPIVRDSDLAVASPIDDDANSQELPVAEQYDLLEDERKIVLRRKKDVTRVSLALLVGLVCILIIFLLIFFFAIQKNNDKEVIVSSSPPTATPNGTESPTPAATLSKTAQVLSELPNQTLSAIEVKGTAQALAFDWLSNDPFLDDYPVWRAIQRFSLATLYFSSNGRFWSYDTGWLSTTNETSNECHWFFTPAAYLLEKEYLLSNTTGACDEDNRLEKLWLGHNNLKGPIPPELFLIPSLRSIVLNNNELTGAIPKRGLERSEGLEHLILSNNQLTSTIPTELQLLRNLSSLLLYQNELTGTIPSTLGQIGTLVWLILDNNHLTGEICSELGQLRNVWRLYLHENQLTNSIPTEVGGMESMVQLSVEVNNLTGTIPTEVGLLTDLSDFYVYGNLLTGQIPSQLGNATKMAGFRLDSNLFTGTLPSELGLFESRLEGGSLSKDTFPDTLDFSDPSTITFDSFFQHITRPITFNVRNNMLSGSIPTDYGRMKMATFFYLYFNQLSGTLPSELGKLKLLERFQFHSNRLVGTIPTELGRLTKLITFAPGENKLSGPFPSEIGALTQLTQLYVAENKLESTIATELGKLYNLKDFLFQINRFTGALPSELGALVQLTQLWVTDNLIGSTMPTEIANLRNTLVVGIENNRFTGAIPSELANLASVKELRLNGNQLSGPIPSELGLLSPNTYWLNISDNALEGTIPSTLGQLPNIQVLAMHDNQLTGSLPTELGMAQRMAYFDVSRNQLSGPIVPDLALWSSCQALFVDHNSFTGTLPTYFGWLQSLKSLRLVGNAMLTGPIPTEIGLLALTGALERLNITGTQISGTLPFSLCLLNASNLGFDCSDTLCGCDCDCAR